MKPEQGQSSNGSWLGRRRGLAFVELLVSLAIGLQEIGAVIALYQSNSGATQFQTGLMRVPENGRQDWPYSPAQPGNMR